MRILPHQNYICWPVQVIYPICGEQEPSMTRLLVSFVHCASWPKKFLHFLFARSGLPIEYTILEIQKTDEEALITFVRIQTDLEERA